MFEGFHIRPEKGRSNNNVSCNNSLNFNGDTIDHNIYSICVHNSLSCESKV